MIIHPFVNLLQYSSSVDSISKNYDIEKYNVQEAVKIVGLENMQK